MKRISFCLFYTILGLSAVAQKKNFSFRREISTIGVEGYYAISLTPEIFQHLNDDFSDLRIYSLTSMDTTENPYVLRIKRKRISSRDFSLPEFNRSYKNKVLFVSFELPPNTGLTNIELAFKEINFFATVNIEGSDDRKNWFEIVNDQKVFSVSNTHENYRYTRVNFPQTKYPFVRISVQSENELHYEGTTFKSEEVIPGEFIPVDLSWKVSEEKRSKQSWIDLTLKYYQPLSALQIHTKNDKDFYRHCLIQIVSDSIKSEKGWIKNYRTVAEGYITSFYDNIFELSNQSAKQVRILIDNQDNEPITISDVKASAPAVKVISLLKPGTNYLFYGNRTVGFASYDLQYFERKIPASIPDLTIGPEENISPELSTTNPLFENKIWLWSIIVAVVGVLGFFTIRMMKVNEAA